jgi:CRISPR-associated protein Cmr4
MLFNTDKADVCVLYAISPVHAGSGQATGAVDLPIQRERHTAWPQIQASGMKGAFRDWFRRYYEVNPQAASDDASNQAEELAKMVFGREEGGSGVDGHAGAMSITDARLLAFPVRSNVAPFVWVMCPALLTRLRRDLMVCPIGEVVPEIGIRHKDGFQVIAGDIDEQSVVLEDLAVKKETPDKALDQLRAAMHKLAPQATRLLLISDENFGFLVQTATEVQPHIKIKYDTGTTQDGSLRYQELLPADTALYCLVFFSGQRGGDNPMAVDTIRSCTKAAIAEHVQIGGDMTMGRGLMEVNWTPANGKGGKNG